MRRLAVPLAILALAAVFGATALAARDSGGPVMTWKTAKFGQILSTKGHLALYTWNQEKGLKVKCTGACAKTWPPLTFHGDTPTKILCNGVDGWYVVKAH